MSQGLSRPTTLLVLVFLAGIVAVGTYLRAEDPLSSPVIGAEDPYTHIVFIKESLVNGAFGDSFYLGTEMYPPGIHAFGGALAPLAGISLYDFARFVPIALGALGIVGMFVLANRLGGPIAGLASALVVAVMPENIFRTNLFFPTALDMALLPAFLLAFLLSWEREEGEPDEARLGIRWGPVLLFAALVPPVAFTHPWLVPLFLVPASLYAALRVARTEAQMEAAVRRLAVPAALVVLATAFAISSRWSESDTGFADFFASMGPLSRLSTLEWPGMMLFALFAGILGLVALHAVPAVGGLALLRARMPNLSRVALAAVAAGGLVALTFLLARSTPPEVNHVNMLGSASILLALVGLVVGLLRPTRVGDLGLCISAVLFPLTALNVFDSEFWPQRTVVYLGFGMALLAANAVKFAHDEALRLVRLRQERRFVAPTALLATVMLLATGVAASDPSTYPWYRLYDDDDFAAFQDLGALLDADPNARAVVRGWQSGLMVKTVADLEQVRFSPKFFNDTASRDKTIGQVAGPLYVVVDHFLLKDVQRGKADLGFLEGKPIALQSADGGLKVYRLEGGAEA